MTIEQQVELLESRLATRNRLGWGLIAAALVSILFSRLLAGEESGAKPLVVEELAAERISAGRIAVTYENGKDAILLSVNEKGAPTLEIFDADGICRLVLTSGELSIRDERGKPAAVLGCRDSESFLRLAISMDQPDWHGWTVDMRATRDGGGLTLFEPAKGKTTAHLGPSAKGYMEFILGDPAAGSRIRLAQKDGEVPTMEIIGPDGAIAWEARGP